MDRTTIRTGTPWEDRVGYSRAVRVGPQVFVSGATATAPDGGIAGEGDPGVQTRQAIQNIDRALDDAGAQLFDVVRTRLFLTDIDAWEAVGDAHAAAFGANPPATTMVEVSALIDPRLLVEVEAVAIIEDTSE